ncbi:copia-type polyprotein, partial [Trifolium medium]|nr:copia-type polyprotein [Trifolium medium]
FDEEGEWDWRSSNEDYNFFPQFEEDDVEPEEPREDHTTPLASPTPSSEEGENSSERTPHFRSLQEIYE